MSLYQEYDSQARAFLSSLQKSVKEVTLPSYFSTSATVHALQGLQKKTKLKNLKLACSDRSVWAALGTLLKESASINSLTINVFLCSFGEEFLSALRINSGLTKLVLLDSLRVLNADHYSALMKALNSNPTVCEVTMKQSHEVSFDISRGQKAVLSFDDDPLEQLIQNSDWESLRPNIICDPPSVSTCQLIQNNDWENLAQHLKENCSSADPADYAEQFNLSTRTFVDKLAVHTLKEYYDDTCQESVILEVSVVETSKLRDVLSNEQEELKRKLQLIEQKLVEVDTKLVEDSNKLEDKATLIQQLKSNLEKFKASLAKNEPELAQWQRKLQVDMSNWTVEEVTFLLQEVGLDQYAYEFAANKIDGAVLQAMDTEDLTANLNVSFKDAKRMLMYIYLADKHHDIYNIPPGVLQWNNDTVCTWLEDNKFAHLEDLFKKNQITGAELAFLEKGDLTSQLKIQAFGDVVKLQKEIAKLKESLNDEQTRAMQTINNNNANNNNDQLVRQLEEVKRFNEELKIALKKKVTKIPEAFICPITQDIMTDPVVASDGHTYERTAIELWLKNKNSSPMTGLQLANKVLTPSHTLKSMIREFVDTNKN